MVGRLGDRESVAKYGRRQTEEAFKAFAGTGVRVQELWWRTVVGKGGRWSGGEAGRLFVAREAPFSRAAAPWRTLVEGANGLGVDFGRTSYWSTCIHVETFTQELNAL